MFRPCVLPRYVIFLSAMPPLIFMKNACSVEFVARAMFLVCEPLAIKALFDGSIIIDREYGMVQKIIAKQMTANLCVVNILDIFIFTPLGMSYLVDLLNKSVDVVNCQSDSRILD